MKGFIEKLIERLEELPTKAITRYKGGTFGDYEGTDYFIDKYKTKDIINELAEEYRNDKVCQTAIMYAENLHKYGVQIDSIWETATQQSMALNQAYMRGRQDERDIFDEWQEKYINTSTNTSTTNANRIRSMTDEELAEFLGGIDHAIDDCEFIVKIGDEWLHDSTADILDWLQSEVKGE